jgi:hypothetical protein
MKLNSKLFISALIMAVLLPLVTRADAPGRHPRYLHSLADLRAARMSLERRPGDAAVAEHEAVAIQEVDRAIQEIRVAVVEDGKEADRRGHEDAALDRSGRLRRALELIREARADIAMPEDNREARAMQTRALRHIEIALRETERAASDMRR